MTHPPVLDIFGHELLPGDVFAYSMSFGNNATHQVLFRMLEVVEGRRPMVGYGGGSVWKVRAQRLTADGKDDPNWKTSSLFLEFFADRAIHITRFDAPEADFND